MSYPRFQLARNFKFFTRTAGDLTLNTTTWADLPTIGTTGDLTLQAQTGDVIEAGLSCRWDIQTSYGFLAPCTIVASAAVNYFLGFVTTTSGEGVPAWSGDGYVARYSGRGASIMYTLQAGDISNGTVTVRLRCRTGSASNKVLMGSAGNPLHYWIKNLGPVDPN